MDIAPPTPIELAFRGDLEDGMAILELGTRRWDPDRPSHHRWWRPGADWVLSDLLDGQDVDVVADAHELPFDDGRFDALVAYAVLEHLARPWLAVAEFARVLKPGGRLFVLTHQTFPVHGYPYDFFRFSDRALMLLAEDAGLVTLFARHSYPCRIVPPPEVTDWNQVAEGFLLSELYAGKP